MLNGDSTKLHHHVFDVQSLAIHYGMCTRVFSDLKSTLCPCSPIRNGTFSDTYIHHKNSKWMFSLY